MVTEGGRYSAFRMRLTLPGSDGYNAGVADCTNLSREGTTRMVVNANEEPRIGDGEPSGGLETREYSTGPTLNAAEAGATERARLDMDSPFRPPLNGSSDGPLPVRPAGRPVATTLLPTEPIPSALVSEPGPNVPTLVPPIDLPTFVPAPVEPATLVPPRRPWVPDAPLPPVAMTAPPPADPPAPIVPPAAVVAVPDPPAVAPAVATSVPTVAVKPPPTGALVLLPGEEVLLQLGALYLTTRRAILYAPTILRAAFLHDIDAVGTVTERSGGWMFLIGLVSLGAGAAAAYVGLTQPGITWQLGELLQANPLLIAIPLLALGLFTLAGYFFWVKRSLFLSVGGRPLIVISVTGWNAKKLEPVDQFVNAFSAAKDRERQRGVD